jgi:hypothetical protein
MMPSFERAADPDRPGGQVLLADGEPVALVWWAHDYDDRTATGWFMQRLEADGEPAGEAPRRLPAPEEVQILLADRALDQAQWVAQAETVELVTAPSVLAAAERALAGELGA